MRIIVLPENPWAWVIVGGILVIAIGYAVFRQFRPPLAERLGADPKHQQAMEVYVGSLPQEQEPTRDDRRRGVAAAIEYLASEHGVPTEEAARNVRLLVAAHDRALSYDLRHEALAQEQAGEYEMALENFERAARLQEEHDPADHKFLQRCVARVRGKLR